MMAKSHVEPLFLYLFAMMLRNKSIIKLVSEILLLKMYQNMAFSQFSAQPIFSVVAHYFSVYTYKAISEKVRICWWMW